MSKKAAEKKLNLVHSGNIYGFFPSINSYQGNRGKLDDCWSALVKEFKFISDDQITFNFYWQGSKYVVALRKVNETNYQGRAIADGEEVAKVYYVLYSNSKGYSLIGTWNEEYSYDSIIEVNN